MTVKELITQLKTFDENTELVFYSSSEMIYFSVSSVSFCEKPYDRENPVVEINE
jgi:hypothetical protein